MLFFIFFQSAQADELDVNAQLFRPALDSRYFLWANETGLAADNAIHFKGVLSYTYRPLVYTGYDGTQTDFLHSVSQLDLLGSYVYGDIRLGVNLPLYAFIQGESPVGEDISQSSIGDLLFDLKYRYPEGQLPIGLGFALRSTLPTSGSTAPVVSSKPVAEVELMVDKKIDDIQLVFNIGHRYQKDFSYELAQFGSQLFYRGGISYRLRPHLGFSAEFIGAHLYQPESGDPRSQEIMLSSWGEKSEFVIQGGAGLGLGKGIGTPAWRAMVGIQYSPKAKPKDCDKDGVLDKNDQCPNIPEDIDGVEDEDGCVDETWMRVIFVDQYGRRVPQKSWNDGKSDRMSDTPFQVKEDVLRLVADIDGYGKVQESVTIPQGKPQTLIVPLIQEQVRLQVTPKDAQEKPLSGVRWRIVPKIEQFFGDEVHLQEQQPFFGDEIHIFKHPDGETFFGDEIHLQELPNRKEFSGDEAHIKKKPGQEGFFGDEAHLQDKSNQKPFFGDEAHFDILPSVDGFFGDEAHLQDSPRGKDFFGDEIHFVQSPFMNTFFGDEAHLFPPASYEILIHAQGYKVHRQSISLTDQESQMLAPAMIPTTALIQNGKIVLSTPVAFNEDSTALTPQSTQALMDLLDVMKGYPAIGSVQIDSLLGNAEPAVREKRAELLQQIAQEKGVKAHQLMYGSAYTEAQNVQEVPIVHVRQDMQNGLFVIQSFSP